MLLARPHTSTVRLGPTARDVPEPELQNANDVLGAAACPSASSVGELVLLDGAVVALSGLHICGMRMRRGRRRKGMLGAGRVHARDGEEVRAWVGGHSRWVLPCTGLCVGAEIERGVDWLAGGELGQLDGARDCEPGRELGRGFASRASGSGGRAGGQLHAGARGRWGTRRRRAGMIESRDGRSSSASRQRDPWFRSPQSPRR